MRLSRHWIVTARAEWVTPPDAADGEPASTQRPMAFQRFDGIGGAARIITACRGQQVPERHLVCTHTQDENGSHQVSLGSVGG